MNIVEKLNGIFKTNRRKYVGCRFCIEYLTQIIYKFPNETA